MTTVNGEFVYADTLGNQTRFYDFSGSVPAAQQGQFKNSADAAGNRTYVVAWTAAGEIAEVRRQDAAGVDGESWLYSYLPATDVNAGLLQRVQLRRPDGIGGWQVVRQVEYAYYDGTVAFGRKGDLKTATVEDSGGTAINTQYYRYYVSSGDKGFAHGLKYVFDGASFARLGAAVADPFTAADAEVTPYATHYLEYDDKRRVTLHAIQGAGSSSAGGIGTFTYSYATSDNPDGPNSWKYKTLETLPDGNQNIIYCNSLGEVMLKVFKDLGDPTNPALQGKQWATFYKYDAEGRILWEAEPSAVLGYDETKADLLNFSDRTNDGINNPDYEYLADSSGLIHVTDFYASTTATEATAGGAMGYIQSHKVQRGELGTAILLDSQSYFAHSGGVATIYPEAAHTTYRNTDGTGAATTSYAYTWYDNSTRVRSQTTSLPVILAGQNGPGSADVVASDFDVFGRPTWTKDAEGHVHYTAFDPSTGAVIKTIVDVNYSLLSTPEQASFDTTGWTPPSTGLHLVTSNEVDGLGRTTRTVDPNGNTTYVVYNDTAHEIRTYLGWNASTHQPTGPVEVLREDRPGSYREVLTYSWNDANGLPVDANGRPSGAELLTDSRAILRSLSRTFLNRSSQEVEVNEYFDLTGLTYSTTTARLGTLGINYYATYFGYDALNNKSRVVNPNGTITITLYDSLERPTATYVGTNDSTTDGKAWTPGNAAAASNMTLVQSYEYDGNAVGDSNLTRSTQYPGGLADPRVTQMVYDWRNRLIAAKAGVQDAAIELATPNLQRPITFLEYDNLGQVISREQYDGDGIAIVDANNDGVPERPVATLLRSRSTSVYDDRGRVFQSTMYIIDQSTGAQDASSQVTDTWYDARGQVIKTRLPGGLVLKQQYDGAGRQTMQYSSDGGGDATWADAGNVNGDLVLQQVQTIYDANGNPIETVTKDRFGEDSASEAGPLGDFSTGPRARVSYSTRYFDPTNRSIAQVNLGTNGGLACTRPADVPDRSDTVLVTTIGYDPAGRPDTVIDPRGIVTKTLYDALGRTTSVIENFTDGVPTDSANRTVRYTYDGAGHVLTQTAVQPVGRTSQTTQYDYGVSGALFSNELIAAVKHPDAISGNPSEANKETFTYNALGEILSKIAPNGAVQSFGYDVLGRLRSETITTTDGSGNPSRQFTYDTLGNLASETDPRGHTTTTVRDSLGRMMQEILPDPDGQSGHPTTVYEYDAAGNLTGVTDARENKTVYAYDLLGRKVQETRPDPDGTGPQTSPIVTYQYNVGGNQTKVTDARGNAAGADAALHTSVEVYDLFGRKVQLILPSPDGVSPQPTTSYAYDRNGNLVSMTDARDNTTTYVYDNLNRRVQMIQPDPDGPTGSQPAPVTQYAYDAIGNLVQTTDPLNHVTDYRYDALNRRIEEIRPAPNAQSRRPSTTFGYDVSGNLTSVIDPLGNQTTYVYNQLNCRSQMIGADPDGTGPQAAPVTQYAYDLAGNLLQITDPLNHATNYAYDALNRKVQEQLPDPNGQSGRPTTEYQYDLVGNLTAVIDALDRTTTYEYDALNRRIRQTLPDPDGAGPLTSGITTYQYDPNGNLTGMVDPLGNAPGGDPTLHTTNYAYDNLNRQIREILPPPQGSGDRPTTQFSYDAVGNLLTRTDPAQNTTTYAYDNLNRRISETNQLNKARSYTYDAAGNVVTMTDRNGRVREFIYDDLNRMTEERWLDGNGLTIHTISFGYDANGRMISLADSDSAYVFGYDDLNRLTSTTDTLAGMAQPIVLTQAYDANSRRTLLSTGIGGTFDLFNHYDYDNLGRVTILRQFSLADGIAAGLLPASGDPWTPLDSKRVDYTYNLLGQATTLMRYSDLAGLNLVASTTYGYDQAHRLITLAHVAGGLPLNYSFVLDVADRITQFTTPDGSSDLSYDANDQLTGATLSGEDYSYDLNGNRTNTGYQTDADNQLAADGTYEYGYDDEGNRTSRTLRDSNGDILEQVLYSWDYRNRLTGVVYHNGQDLTTRSVHYTYDGQDRRIAKQVDADGNGSTDLSEHYVYDGPTLLLVLGDGGVSQRYLQAGGQVLAEETVGSPSLTRWGLADHEGSVRDVISSAGLVLDHIVYDSFGQLLTQSSPTNAMRMGYTGQVQDEETGLAYYNARYYDPAVGRFLSPDPLSFGAGDGNLYRYVGNDPLNRVDPTGLCEEEPQATADEEGARYQEYLQGEANTDESAHNARVSTQYTPGTTYPYVHADAAMKEAARLANYYRYGNPGLAEMYDRRVQQWANYLQQQSAERTAQAAAANAASGYDPRIDFSSGARNSTAGRAVINGVEFAVNLFAGYSEVIVGAGINQNMPTTEWGGWGRNAGRALGIGQTAVEYGIGGKLILGGGTITVTTGGAGAIVGVPAALVGTVVAGHAGYATRNIASLQSVHPSETMGSGSPTPQQQVSQNLEPNTGAGSNVGSSNAGQPAEGTTPRNAHLAGQKHPVTEVPFDAQGYPDFRVGGYVKAEVQITQTGTRSGDFAAANEAAGYSRTPEGFTWHHHQDGTTMQLVPSDIHVKTGHTGGFAK